MGTSEETKKETSKKEKKLEKIPKERKKLWSKLNNSVKVLLSGILSIILILFIYFYVIKDNNKDSVGYWNFIILIVSSPVAFVIWQLRDENIRQEIENQRKDINLKEFQKLSEWVSGAHLPEIKFIEKTIEKSSKSNNETAVSSRREPTEITKEYSNEYGLKLDTTDFDTFDKLGGAVALQISAIYNLLPFFRGDYGESFRLPALNLLKSAWQAMLQNELKELKELNSRQNRYPLGKRVNIIENLKQKACSPMGVALTYVLLSTNRDNTQLNLKDFLEIRSNLCLAGMNFNYYKKINPSMIINLSRVDLYYADLSHADLSDADLSYANLSETDLDNAVLYNTDLRNFSSQLNSLNLSWKTIFRGVKTIARAKITITDFYTRIHPDWKHQNDPQWEHLPTEAEKKEAMQKFCNETGMIIFDDDKENIVAEPKS